ncbi:polycystic kidney disease protein 1-like 2 isoform X2 [Melanotaenia boesemani]|uniref:polycystic kidney disease protein 1-like 2 isoform X2 n=1 Tax=Melanotaenia boesemani TaxID=1250792 RepID=UPI001C05CCB8|nr:polycystic kidney disease protein 1-like 2 isoform X2 [Melanotaenia boesemani]
MNMLLQNPFFLWISVGCLFLPEKSEACPNNGLPAQCDFVSGNVCLELAGESKTWSEARSSCGKKGGKLLKMPNSSIKIFLSGITKEGNTSNLTWWMGERIQVDHRQPTLNFSRTLCTYMKLNPVQYLTSDCSKKRGFLCIHTLLSPSSTKTTTMSNNPSKSRFKRSVDDMLLVVGNINKLLGVATTALLDMEKTAGEPTNEHRDNFVQSLLTGTKLLTRSSVNLNIVNTILNLSTGIMIFSMKKCDIDTNPNPNNFFENVFQIIQTISLLTSPPLNQDTVTRYSTGVVYQSTRKPADLGNMVIGSESNGGFIKLPPYSALNPFLAKYDTIVAQMATFTSNPHPSYDNISGTVCNVLLSDGTSDIMLKNLSTMIEIFLHRPNSSALMNSTFVLEEGHKSLTTFNVSDPQMTIIFDVEPSVNVSLNLTLSYGSPSNSTYFSNTTILNSTRGYRWMITPDMLQQTPGVWYVDARFLNSMQGRGVQMTISSFVSKCLYWHTENNTWSTDGCRVGEKSTPELTQCLCNHLTLFGSSFFVMPNYVDVSRTAELFSTVTQNYVVLSLLCAFFGLYLITLMWACYADRRASSKRKITLLMDNHPAAQYNYLIGVQTGHRKKAGTSAKVSMKLIGSEGESCTHELTDPDKKVFERGSTDMFVLAAPFPLGEVRNIRLQHDCSGGHPSWYISKVTIQDLQTRHVWHFFCNCWLSDDRGDGMTKKTFNAAKSNEITCFRNIFQSRTSTGFRDEHIWVSIVDPPSRSPFTRAQRVSCCMSLLLCTMAINIAFWNIPVDANSPVIFSLGSMQISWQEFMVGVQSGLLMFPINILIITIFRSIKPRMSSSKSKGDTEMNLRSPAFTIPALLRNTEEIISLLKGSPRNKMSDSQKLQSTDDLLPALDSVHGLIQNMQGETESDNHLVFCSKFLLAGLCHILVCLKKLDGSSFSDPQSYQQVLSLTDLMVRKAEMVFSSHLANCPPPVRKQKKKSAGCQLPWWYVFLGWFLLLSISGISTYFTLLYGFAYGKEKSIKWVMSLGLSLFESIFILQPLKVIGVAVFFAILLKPVAVEDTEEVEQVLLAQEDKCRRYTGRATL